MSDKKSNSPNPLHLDPDVQRVLVSTTSRFTGGYSSPSLSVDHAWPDFSRHQEHRRLEEGPVSRSGYLISFRTEPIKKQLGPQPDAGYIGDNICTFLAVFFGKRFDNHGMIQKSGRFTIPDLSHYSEFTDPDLPHNSHEPRPDLKIPLSLNEIGRLEPAMLEMNSPGREVRYFLTAGEYYLRALQTIERRPDVAYLYLVTAGEIIAEYFDYDLDDLLDAKTKKVFQSIEAECTQGAKHVKHLKGRMYQVRQKFARSLRRLLSSNFFLTDKPGTRLKEEEIDRTLKAAYDLRSKFVHVGASITNWIGPKGGLKLSEVQIGTPVLTDKDLAKTLERAPRFNGLERVIRYALLSLLNRSPYEIYPQLPTSDWEPQAEHSEDEPAGMDTKERRTSEAHAAEENSSQMGACACCCCCCTPL